MAVLNVRFGSVKFGFTPGRSCETRKAVLHFLFCACFAFVVVKRGLMVVRPFGALVSRRRPCFGRPGGNLRENTFTFV